MATQWSLVFLVVFVVGLQLVASDSHTVWKRQAAKTNAKAEVKPEAGKKAAAPVAPVAAGTNATAAADTATDVTTESGSESSVLDLVSSTLTKLLENLNSVQNQTETANGDVVAPSTVGGGAAAAAEATNAKPAAPAKGAAAASAKAGAAEPAAAKPAKAGAPPAKAAAKVEAKRARRDVMNPKFMGFELRINPDQEQAMVPDTFEQFNTQKNFNKRLVKDFEEPASFFPGPFPVDDFVRVTPKPKVDTQADKKCQCSKMAEPKVEQPDNAPIIFQPKNVNFFNILPMLVKDQNGGRNVKNKNIFHEKLEDMWDF